MKVQRLQHVMILICIDASVTGDHSTNRWKLNRNKCCELRIYLKIRKQKYFLQIVLATVIPISSAMTCHFTLNWFIMILDYLWAFNQWSTKSCILTEFLFLHKLLWLHCHALTVKVKVVGEQANSKVSSWKTRLENADPNTYGPKYIRRAMMIDNLNFATRTFSSENLLHICEYNFLFNFLREPENSTNLISTILII